MVKPMVDAPKKNDALIEISEEWERRFSAITTEYSLTSYKLFLTASALGLTTVVGFLISAKPPEPVLSAGIQAAQLLGFSLLCFGASFVIFGLSVGQVAIMFIKIRMGAGSSGPENPRTQNKAMGRMRFRFIFSQIAAYLCFFLSASASSAGRYGTCWNNCPPWPPRFPLRNNHVLVKRAASPLRSSRPGASTSPPKL